MSVEPLSAKVIQEFPSLDSHFCVDVDIRYTYGRKLVE
jgi:hypothetical protein